MGCFDDDKLLIIESLIFIASVIIESLNVSLLTIILGFSLNASIASLKYLSSIKEWVMNFWQKLMQYVY